MKRIGYIQFDVSHDIARNIACVAHELEHMRADLIVLPELCMCGYLFADRTQLRSVAQPVPNGEIVRQMQMLSERYRAAILFGMAELDGTHIYNTAVAVDNGRYVGKYRKVHLSDLEKELFDRGTQTTCVLSVGGVRIGVQICFDLWFPEVSRAQRRQGAELLCALADFGGPTTWDIARTRAIENRLPLLLCNRIGQENTSEIQADFLGKSCLILPSGDRRGIGTSGKQVSKVFRYTPVEQGNAICRDFDAEIALHES